jgi:hypothetical protein
MVINMLIPERQKAIIIKNDIEDETKNQYLSKTTIKVVTE